MLTANVEPGVSSLPLSSSTPWLGWPVSLMMICAWLLSGSTSPRLIWLMGLPAVPVPVPAAKLTVLPSATLRRPAPEAGGVSTGASFSGAMVKPRVKGVVPPLVSLTMLRVSVSLSPVSEVPV